MAGVKHFLLTIAVVALLGCGKKEEAQPTTPKPEAKKPEPPKVVLSSTEAKALVEAAIRRQLKKPEGELTKEDLEKVTLIDLPRRGLTDGSLLAGLTNLKELSLNDNRLTDVSPLEGLTKLETLWLESNRLTDISTLKGLVQLVDLTLCNNNLTNGQLKYLTGLKQLKVLNLGSNQLTNVRALEVLKQLRFLHLQNNPDLTKTEVDNLQKALPNCLIIHNAKK